MSGHPGWFVQKESDYGFAPYYGMLPLQLEFTPLGDTMTRTAFQIAFAELNESSCIISEIFDNWHSLGYTAPIGLTYEHSSWIGGHNTLYLIGSIVNNIHDGITQILSGTSAVSKEQIDVYPNPTSGLLFIEALHPTAEITLFDSHGRCMFSQQGSVPYIDLSNLMTGLYFLRIQQSGMLIMTPVIRK